MKRFLSILLLLGAFLTSFVSCSKDDDNTKTNTNSETNSNTSIVGTSWYYNDDEEEITISFRNNGVVKLVVLDLEYDESDTYTGSYTYENGEGDIVMDFDGEREYMEFTISGSRMYLMTEEGTLTFRKK